MQKIGPVLVNGFGRNKELFSNLPVFVTSGDQPENFPFPGGEGTLVFFNILLLVKVIDDNLRDSFGKIPFIIADIGNAFYELFFRNVFMQIKMLLKNTDY